MANHKSAAKRARQEKTRTARASNTKSTIRTFEKRLLKTIDEKKKDVASDLLVAYSKKIDKAASKGLLHRNNASRKVSRLSIKVSAL